MMLLSLLLSLALLLMPAFDVQPPPPPLPTLVLLLVLLLLLLLPLLPAATPSLGPAVSSILIMMVTISVS
uniref:Secreted protein n=1 Tax=Anopheles darlingi TaxID=43151 RepID=A0A2M4D7X8_ANODA